jgi:lysophospholipase L1-like esterase
VSSGFGVTRASRARRIATAAAYGGGGIGALGVVGGAAYWGVVVGQGKLARRRIPAPTADPPASNGTVWAAAGVSAGRPPLRIAVIGDSMAAGYGVHRDRETPGVRLAVGLSAVARRPVQLTNVATVGAQSSALAGQIARLPRHLDLAVVIVGANDVTHRCKPEESVRYLSDAVHQLRADGVEVVVGTCPDLGTVRPISQPLRTLARRTSRSLAAAQTIAVVEAGGRTVSLADLLGPLFAERREFFSDDQFHPSAQGYAAATDAMLPSCLDALGLRTKARSATPFSTRRARPVARVAAKAASHAGAEVAAAELPGQPAGRWARLRRRRADHPVAASPEQARPVTMAVTRGATAVARFSGRAAQDHPDRHAGERGRP